MSLKPVEYVPLQFMEKFFFKMQMANAWLCQTIGKKSSKAMKQKDEKSFDKQNFFPFQI